jgi:hypothetical protein
VGDLLAYIDVSTHLGLVDLSDLRNPTTLPSYAVTGDRPRDLVKIPGVAGVAVAANEYGVRIIDLNAPAAPVELGFWEPTTGAVIRVDMDGDRIAAAGETNVWVLNASVLGTPVEWTSFSVSGNVLDVAIEGDHVYVSVSGAASVRVWDVSDALSPAEVASIDVPLTNAQGLDIHAGRLYIAADARHGLLVHDITDPTDPFEIATADTPAQALSVGASDRLIAVADAYGGVEIWSSVPVLDVLFADGFENGDTSAWSAAAP